MPPTSQKQILKQSKTLLKLQVHEQYLGKASQNQIDLGQSLFLFLAKYLPAALD